MNRIELGLTRLRDAFHAPKSPPLAQFLNLWSLRDEALVGVNLDFSTVYELEPEDIALMDPARAELFLTQSRAFLNSLPTDATLQFVVRIQKGDLDTIRDYRQTIKTAGDPLSQLITDWKIRFIENKFTQRRRYFLFVTSHPKDRKVPMPGLIPVFQRPWRETAAAFHETRLREHAALEQVVAERLHGMGIACRKLLPQEVFSLAFKHLNPRHPHEPHIKRLSPRRTLREQIAFYPLEESFAHARVNGRYFRGLSLLRLPETSHFGYTQRLLRSLWPECDLVLTIDSLDTETTLSGLKLRNNITRSLALSAWTKNYEAEQKHLELDDLITEIRASAQRIFRFSMSVLIQAESLEELNQRTNPVLSAFHDFASAEAASDDMSHFRTYLGSIPGHGDLNERKFYIQTNALAGLLPLTASWRGSKGKKMIVETPIGEFVGLDPFDPNLPAKHGLIIGTTGSGKSFTTNYLLSDFLVESPDNHVVVVDVGGSYRKLAQVFDGEYLEVTISPDFGFNPFPRRSDIAPGGQYDDDAVAYLSLLIARMCLGTGHALTVYDKAFLEKAIKNAYDKREEILLADVRQELTTLSAEYPSAKTYADSLELWTAGMYGKIFNQPGSLNLSKRLVIFDLQNLENHPDLQGVYFFVIRSIIWGKLLNRKLQKIIAIDEGWKFFNDDVGAELIENLYRTARKFNAAILSISQSPKDFLDSKASAAIVANSYVKYILKLAKGHELLSQFELNANEIEAIKLLQSSPKIFSDLFIKFGNRSLIARIEPCPLDYWICTTDPQDRVREDELRAQHKNASEIEILLTLAEAQCKGNS